MSTAASFKNPMNYATTGFSTLPVYTNQNANQHTASSMDDLVGVFQRSFGGLGTSHKADGVFSPPISNCPDAFTEKNFAITTAEINDHDFAISDMDMDMDMDMNANQPSSDAQAQSFQCAPFALNDAEKERRIEWGCKLRKLSSDVMDTADTDINSVSDPMDTGDDSDEQLVYHNHFQHIDVDVLLCHPDIYWNGKLATSGYSWQAWKEMKEREKARRKMSENAMRM